MLVIAIYGTRHAARLAMNDEHKRPTGDSDGEAGLNVRLVSVATSDAKRRLAAAIELLLRAGANHGDDCPEVEGTEDIGDVK